MISLPHLFVFGLFLAGVGVLFVVAEAVHPVSAACTAGVVGGFLTCVLLAAILISIDIWFLGRYAYLAWLIAFLAGYAVAAPLGYFWSWKVSRNGRASAPVA